MKQNIRFRARAAWLLLITTACVVITVTVWAAPNDLDSTFGGVDRVLTKVGDGGERAYALAVQPDGKVIVAGDAYVTTPNNSYDFALVRYNPNGSLDTTFDGDGKVTTNFNGGPGGRDDQVNAVAVQPDGKILAAGFATVSGSHQFALARYNSTGSLDNTFGVDGKVTTSIGAGAGYGEANAMVLQPDGKIVLAGISVGARLEFTVVRYNANGTLDVTFDGDGIVQTAIGNFNGEEARAVALQGDGKIVVAGFANTGTDNNNGANIDFALARYNSNGSLDTTFDGDGKVTTPIGTNTDRAYALTIQPDGKLVVAGYAEASNGFEHGALAQYNTDGSLDATFDGDGKVTTIVFSGGTDAAYGIALQPDGKIVTIGTYLVRYNPNGSLDTSFDGDGIVTNFFPSTSVFSDHGSAVAVLPSGKLVATAKTAGLPLFRFNPDGSHDNTLSPGKVVTPFHNDGGLSGIEGTDAIYALALQPDGKIIAAGSTDSDVGLIRYNPDGTLDASFGTGGRVRTPIALKGAAHAVAVQPDGRIVAAGYAGVGNGGTATIAVVRYNPDGSQDTSFSGDGVFTNATFLQPAAAYAMALLPDGKIIVAGQMSQSNQSYATLWRLNPNGTLDSSFGFNGIARATGSFVIIYALAIQSDGKLVIAGSESGGSGYDFMLLRFNANGSIDTTFDGDGKVLTPIGGGNATDQANALAIQPDGKIVAAGWSFNGSNYLIGLARYNPDGSPDTTFDGDGKVTTTVGGLRDQANAVAVLQGGKILIAGVAGSGNDISSPSNDFTLVQYNGNGSLDTTFDDDGKLVTSLYATNDQASAMIFQPDGKLIVGGTSTLKGTSDFALMRYVYNSGQPCTYILSPNGQNLSAAAQSGSVGVTADNGCAWTATSQASWITITSGASGSGNGSVNFSITANTGTARTGTLTIAGQTYTVAQDGLSCSYSIAPNARSFSASAGSSSVDVTTPPGCAWTATSNAAFINVSSGGSGTGNGIVNYSVSTNTGLARTGTLTIAGATFTVTQDGPLVVLTTDQVMLNTWKYQGRSYAYVRLSFPDAGYRVPNWGQVVRSGNDFSADASVERLTGPTVLAITTTAQIYDLGPLTDGNYTFTFKNSGTFVKSQAFTVNSTVTSPNPIDDARQFVRQQYRDFLNREADPAGEDFWTDNITKCNDPARRPPGQTVEQCTLRQRETTSGAFFLSPEFQYTGYFVLRMYQGALGRQPKLSEFVPDAQFVGNGIIVNGQLSGAKINQNKADFATQFVNCTDAAKYRCQEFKAIYDGLTNQQFVDKLFQTTGVNASAPDRAALVNELNANPTTGRASVLQKVVDGINVISEGNQQFTTTYGEAFYNSELNRAFVQLEYFGYMRRDPDDAGYAFWLGKLNQFSGSFVNAEMVLAFISSPEYRARFGQP